MKNYVEKNARIIQKRSPEHFCPCRIAVIWHSVWADNTYGIDSGYSPCDSGSAVLYVLLFLHFIYELN